MSDNVPRLTGGILFGLMLEARKLKSKVRSGFSEERTDGLSETDIMKSLVDIFTGETQQMPYENTFKKNVSDYKKCIISKAEYLPFDDSRFINLFKDSVEQNKKDTLESMSAFINEKFSERKLKWLVSAVVESICTDETVNDSENFKISPNDSVFKQGLLRVEVIEIESFLLDVMRYIFVSKLDNTLGKPTFEAWHSQSGERTPWEFNNAELGQHMNDLEITRYNPSVEELDEQTAGIVEQEHVEESDTENEEKSKFNTRDKESMKQQVLNNPKIINQHAQNIYNDEVNFNVTPARKILSPDEYYNLFIIFGEKYADDSFTLGNGRVFELTNTAIKQKFSQFTLEDMDEIIGLPALFLPEYSKINNEIEIGFLGKLEEIDKTEGIGYSKFYFRKERKINMKLIESNKSKLRIDEGELNRTHWAIKRANLKLVIEEITNDNETE